MTTDDTPDLWVVAIVDSGELILPAQVYDDEGAARLSALAEVRDMVDDENATLDPRYLHEHDIQVQITQAILHRLR